MCGIALAVGAVDDEVADAVRRMSGAQSHRGPDDDGFFREDGIALAHRRLSIIDLSAAGHQPMRDPDSGMQIVYNGEVYNFAAVRAELEGKGVRFDSQTDTEVVLKAYAQWGRLCVERLRGMFVFAIWDPRARQLFVARDRMGIKPLYWARVERGDGRCVLLAASELRALLASGLVERRLDPAALSTFVWHGFVRGRRALVRGVHELPRGSTATLSADDPHVDPASYWQPPRGVGRSDDVEALRHELEEAVRLRLISDVPLGVFLSGGIDSSAVAALAARAGGATLRTFGVGFEEAEYDESQHAAEVARAIGADHTHVRLGAARFKAQLDDALGSIDQPTYDQLNTYVVSRAAREAGITVAVAGLGGDELFGGYATFRDVPRACRWARRLRGVPAPLRHALAAAVVRWRNGAPGEVAPQVRWGKLADVLDGGGDVVSTYQAHYALFTRRFHDELLGDAADRSVEDGLLPEDRDALRARVRDESPLAAVSLLEIDGFIGSRLLRDCDAASMAVSLELRVPLIDHRVVEKALALSDALRFEPLGRKQLLRDLALDRLPPQTFERPKAGFELPIASWLESELRDEVSETLLDAELCRRVGLAPEAVARLWRAFDAKAPGIYWSRVWSLFVLLWWCRKYEVWLR